MNEQITFLALAALTTGLVQLCKQAKLPDRAIPFLALAMGIVIAAVGKSYLPAQSVADVVLYGLGMGLSSMGLYSGGKTIIETK